MPNPTLSFAIRALVPAMFFAAAGPAPLTAQVRGVAVDAAGAPVRGATVELWAGQQRVAAAESDSAGAFRLAEPTEADRLSARRLGMRTRVMEIGPADSVVRVRMEEQALVLAPLVAEAETRVCPNREDPRARALWERMRSRYWHDTSDSVVVFSLAEFWSGTAAREEVGVREGAASSAGWTVTQPSRSLLDTRSSGYAWRSAGGPGERTASWSYLGLDGGAWQHFTHPSFGALHTFSVVRAGADGTVIGFCPRDRLRRRGQITGALTVAPDTTLARARWAFRTPRPVEDAGGEAVYLPPSPALHGLLLAEESLFWRRSTGGRFYFEGTRNSGWRVMDGSFRSRDAFEAALRPDAVGP